MPRIEKSHRLKIRHKPRRWSTGWGTSILQYQRKPGPMNPEPNLPSQLAAQFATEPLLVTDRDRIRFANQAFADLVGVPLSDLEGKGVDQLITILDEPLVVGRLRSALHQGQPFRGEAACHTASGGTIPVDLSVIPVEADAEVLYVVSALDLRHRKQLEHHLWHSQRLDAVTQLADGISHEINNAIQVIGGFTTMASPADLPTIDRAARRAGSLFQELLEFSRRRPTTRGPLDLNAVISHWHGLLEALLGPELFLNLELSENLPPVHADRVELQHILINLVVNARDAMPDGGTLTIASHPVRADQRLDDGDLDERLGEFVVLTVSDTGIGMDAETKAQLFQPFFTTKGSHGPRGLGLATVQQIVRETGGLLWVRSQPKNGTSVEVHFQALRDEAASAGSDPADPSAPRRGSETILLVDDDPDVLEVARRGLEFFGYRVVAAGSAAEATTIAAARGEEIAVLVTDVILPGQRGTGLAKELIADWPHLRILFISGAPNRGETLAPRAAHLTKPFSPDQLAQAVQALLDA